MKAGRLALAILAGIWGLVLWRSRLRPKPARQPGAEILVDGSNVMWWDGDRPQLATLIAVIRLLERQGKRPGVIFDASVGHRLWGRYADDAELALALGLPEAQVFVVPKGESADRFLLSLATQRGLAIVTNDRYRDWPQSQDLRLIRGGWRDGSGGGRPWLDSAKATH